MFEMSASYLSGSWWVGDMCMARIGEQGMRPGCFEHKLLVHLLVDGRLAHGERRWRERERERGRQREREREGEREREREREGGREGGREGQEGWRERGREE